MSLRFSFLVLLLLGFSACARRAAEPVAAPAPPTATVPESDPAVLAIIEEIRAREVVPAIGAAIVTTETTRVAATGLRRINRRPKVTVQDKWHLGSNTKAMTATVIARLVEREELDWNTTLAEIFPDVEMHEGYRDATVLQILCHQGGFPANVSYHAIKKTLPLPEQRRQLLERVVKSKPKYVPGSKTSYSNVGFVIAGAIIEKVTGEAWEDVIHREVFDPLGMESVGFGGMGTPGLIDQPWPHHFSFLAAPKNGPDVDNPPVMAPAGTVHCSLEDYAKFIREHMLEGTGPNALLTPESYKTLHTPVGEMAPGWLVLQRPWAGGTALTHTGSNTMNYAVVWMSPARDFAVIVTMNLYRGAPGVCDEVAGRLIELHLAAQ